MLLREQLASLLGHTPTRRSSSLPLNMATSCWLNMMPFEHANVGVDHHGWCCRWLAPREGALCVVPPAEQSKEDACALKLCLPGLRQHRPACLAALSPT